jgi:hypothetical protein
MDPSTVGDDLNEVSVLVNVAHRLLLAIRDDVDADPALQAILDDLNAAHDQLDLALESIGTALDQVDQLSATDRPREQRTPIH